MLRYLRADATERLFDDERRDLVLGFTRRRILDGNLRKHGEYLRDAAIGDPNLGAIQNVMAAVIRGHGACANGLQPQIPRLHTCTYHTHIRDEPDAHAVAAWHRNTPTGYYFTDDTATSLSASTVQR